MTEDARNSLIAVGSVTAIFAVGYLLAWLIDGVEFPSWSVYALLGLNLLMFLINIARGIRRRWRRKHPAAPHP